MVNRDENFDRTQGRSEALMAKVVIAHPFDIWSTGMAYILMRSGCDVIGQWTNGAEALVAAHEAEADLLVIGGGLLEQVFPNGHTEATRHNRTLRGHYSGKIVIVLDPGAQLSPQEFVEWDVEGLILSNASASDVADCIAQVRMGHRWLDPELLGTAGHGAPRCTELSVREAEVARLAASGLSNKKIAQKLAVSDGTIKMHMHNILTKLHLVSRVELSRLFGESRRPH